MLQISINEENVPGDWKRADVVPIFIRGDRGVALMYRSVSLTNITFKKLQSIQNST